MLPMSDLVRSECPPGREGPVTQQWRVPGAAGALRRVDVLIAVFAAVIGFGCGTAAESHAYHQPSAEEVEARELFLAAHPDLPPAVAHQIRRFQVSPEDALRRVEYVRQEHQLSSRRKNVILSGVVQPGMTAAEVRAAWGEPVEIQHKDSFEFWIYPAEQSENRVTVLRFQDGRMILRRDESSIDAFRLRGVK